MTNTLSQQNTAPLSRAKHRTRGIWMVLVGSTLWGLSGTAAQQLFQADGFEPGWLVTVRMGVSGLLLLVMVGIQSGWRRVFEIWQHPRDGVRVCIFGLFGLVGVQYTYFASIQLGNAATATFLQYLAPAVILMSEAVRRRTWPSGKERAALGLALVGTFLLVTNGSLRTMVVPPGAVIWGLLSAVALAFYTLYPGRLMSEWGAALTTGWAMFIGSLPLLAVARPWQSQAMRWHLSSASLVAFVVLFGTLAAFYLYLSSMHHITPTEASLLANIEPLSAAAAGALWLHTPLGVSTLLGGLCILGTVSILATGSRSGASSRTHHEETYRMESGSP